MAQFSDAGTARKPIAEFPLEAAGNPDRNRDDRNRETRCRVVQAPTCEQMETGSLSPVYVAGRAALHWNWNQFTFPAAPTSPLE